MSGAVAIQTLLDPYELLITMLKEAVILYKKKNFEKW